MRGRLRPVDRSHRDRLSTRPQALTLQPRQWPGGPRSLPSYNTAETEIHDMKGED